IFIFGTPLTEGDADTVLREDGLVASIERDSYAELKLTCFGKHPGKHLITGLFAQRDKGDRIVCACYLFGYPSLVCFAPYYLNLVGVPACGCIIFFFVPIVLLRTECEQA